MSSLHDIQSILDESKEKLSSELYNKLSIACKKSFNDERNSQVYVRVKVMFFKPLHHMGNNYIVPKFRFEIIPVTRHQLEQLINRNEESIFTVYRSHYCDNEMTEMEFNEKEFCSSCEEESNNIFKVCTGEYIVHTYKIGSALQANWLSSHQNPFKKISEPENFTPQREE